LASLLSSLSKRGGGKGEKTGGRGCGARPLRTTKYCGIPGGKKKKGKKKKGLESVPRGRGCGREHVFCPCRTEGEKGKKGERMHGGGRARGGDVFYALFSLTFIEKKREGGKGGKEKGGMAESRLPPIDDW